MAFLLKYLLSKIGKKKKLYILIKKWNVDFWLTPPAPGKSLFVGDSSDDQIVVDWETSHVLPKGGGGADKL